LARGYEDSGAQVIGWLANMSEKVQLTARMKRSIDNIHTAKAAQPQNDLDSRVLNSR